MSRNPDIQLTSLALRRDQAQRLKAHRRATAESASSYVRRLLDEHFAQLDANTSAGSVDES